jgi:hypothetical protein
LAAVRRAAIATDTFGMDLSRGPDHGVGSLLRGPLATIRCRAVAALDAELDRVSIAGLADWVRLERKRIRPYATRPAAPAGEESAGR